MLARRAGGACARGVGELNAGTSSCCTALCAANSSYAEHQPASSMRCWPCLLIITHACPALPCHDLQADETIAKVVALANALETTRFAEFWSLAAANKDVVGLGGWLSMREGGASKRGPGWLKLLGNTGLGARQQRAW